MKRQLQYEIRKIFYNKRFLLFLLILGMISILEIGRVIYLPNEDGFSLYDISSVYQMIPEESPSKQLQWLESQLQDSMEQLDWSDEQVRSKIKIYQQLYSQADSIISYGDYLQQIEEQAGKILRSSSLGYFTAFMERNAQKTATIYAGLSDVVPQFCFLDAVAKVLDDFEMDGLLLVMVFIISLCCFHIDEADGREFLLKTTIGGRKYLSVIKYLTVILSGSVVLMVNMFIRLFSVLLITPRKAWFAPIQSMPGYLESPWKLCVWQYIVFYIVCKWIALLLMESLIFLFAALWKNQIYTGLGVLITAFIQFSLWKQIDAHSVYLFWKQFNFFSIVNVPQYFSTYLNIDMYNYPVNNIMIGVLFCILTIGICFIIGKINWKRGQISTAKYTYLSKKRRKKTVLRRGIVFYEFHKLWIINKGLIFLLVFIVVQYLILQGSMIYSDESTYFYRMYSEKLLGELSSEKEDILKSEEKKMEENENTLASYRVQYETGEITYMEMMRYEELFGTNEAKTNAFYRVKTQYEMLKNIQEQGYQVQYVDLTPWNYFFGENAVWVVLEHLMQSLAVLIFPLWSYSHYERRNHMESLIFTSGSYLKVRRAKIHTISIFACINAMISIIPFSVYVFCKYGWSGWNAPCLSLLLEHRWNPPLTIGLIFLIFQLLQILLVIGLADIFLVCTKPST